MLTVELIVMLAMIAVNAVFAAFEIALASVTVSRLKLLARENRPGGAAALHMKEHMEASLAAVQIGITLVGAVAAATGGAGAERKIAPVLQSALGLAPTAAEVLAIATVVVPFTVVSIMFGELIPKVFTLRNKELVCLKLSPVMRVFAMAVFPAVWFFEHAVLAVMRWGERRRPQTPAAARHEATELQELRACTSLARMSRLIGLQEERIILGAARLSSQTVREIMVPADAIRMLNQSATLAEALVAAHMDMHTRFPVTERPGDPQAITGYVNFKDIVAVMRLAPQDPSLKAIMRPLPAYRDDLTLALCLEGLIRDSHHIALIRDQAGAVAGLISLEDIIEELVGDIRDEYDRLPGHVMPSGHMWVAGGGVAPARLKEVTGIDLAGDPPVSHSETLDAWVRGHLGRDLEGGEILERGRIRVVIRKVRRNRVWEAQIGRLDPPLESR